MSQTVESHLPPVISVSGKLMFVEHFVFSKNHEHEIIYITTSMHKNDRANIYFHTYKHFVYCSCYVML